VYFSTSFRITSGAVITRYVTVDDVKDVGIVLRCLIARVPVLESLTPPPFPQPAPRKDTGIYSDPFKTTITISPINPGSQPRDDAGNEALGSAGFGEGMVRQGDFSSSPYH